MNESGCRQPRKTSPIPSSVGSLRSPRWIALSSCLALTLATSRADGFRSGTMGTQGLAISGARTVFIDDASAVAHNPANLMELERWEAAAEPTLVYHSVEFTSPAGGKAETADPWKFLPHAFVGGPLVADKAALGLGITVPYGFALDWQDGGALRYAAPHYVELQTLNFNPTLALRLLEGLNLGLGVDVLYSQIELRQFFPWSFTLGIPGLPDSEFQADGDGVGLGANAGLTWDFLPRQRLVATVRAPTDVDYHGKFRSDNLPFVPGGNATASFDSHVEFPTIVALGYGFQATDWLQIAAQVEWLEFSRFESLPVEVGAPLSNFSQTVPQAWRDTWTAGIGASARVTKSWTVRASYQFFESPVPEQTFSPTIPDTDQNVVTMGLAWSRSRHRLAAAYSKVFYEPGDISANVQPAFVGRYEFDVHMFSATYGLRF